MKHVVAFDVSMGKSYWVVYNADRHCEFEGEIRHTRSDFEGLHACMEKLIEQDGEQPSIVFEATGVYSRQLERFMQDHQYTYCLLNPLEAKLQSASMRMHKTDRSDAHRLALTHFTVSRREKEVPNDFFQQLKSLSRFYQELDGELSTLRNRMHKVIQLTFSELETIFTSRSELCLHVIQLFPHPDLVNGLSKTVIRNRILKSTDKKLSAGTAEKKAIQLLEAAQNSYPAVSATDVLCDQLRIYVKRYLEILRQREALIRQMEEMSMHREDYQVLLSFPGIGVNTAVRLLAEIGDIRRFDNPKQLNAFAGIDIRRFQSGKTFFQDKINKRGNKHLRKLLYLVIQNMIKQRRFGNNHLVEYYDKVKTQPYNKCHKVASIACVNKLLKCLFYLITHNQHYEYQCATRS
ncbi:transposase [Aneurinibacillus soli]|uniref:Transposase IS116/IS110/IS902 family protein n=1 Tax=Aneurinibacillus soli TaxID=1500254 RepID=A0A0U5AW10_9BACL|nr:IS110 family transposase [Aneurinibacillus soli]PYE56979.1 transposase [Aneurinibacillus soli]BAU26446.1 Transposase IS116/IS110/IS902 family protein [Aneurinibacillus soli]BAU26875.1 Transposase IS116/IS110/IS902 family protein [Aneurinibacillus soli]BAU27302.1 Transposase IS116/IS110/IS902 family protein [Aneurinibacillus soli]BAU27925.1 Transposase IS116/IS110/IS902 family protein [Aneurinibacillus soli]